MAVVVPARAQARHFDPLAGAQPQRAVLGRAGQEIGLADEAGDEAVPRVDVDVAGSADLLHLARAHHRDAVAHGQGFFLVVGDEDER
jgi:hypothetical protein